MKVMQNASLFNLLIISILLFNSYSINLYSASHLEKEFLTACTKGDLNGVRKLLSKDINLDSIDSDGRTGLIRAIINKPKNNDNKNNFQTICQLLLIRNANANIKDKYNWDALMYALHNNHKDLVELLNAKRKSY